MPFCNLRRISPTFCTVALLPIEPTPLLFIGWHINGVDILPPPPTTTTTVRRQGRPVGSRARASWMTLLRLRAENAAARRNAPRDSGRPGRRHEGQDPETRGQPCWSCNPSRAIQLRRGADPGRNDHTCLLSDTPVCSTVAGLALRI